MPPLQSRLNGLGGRVHALAREVADAVSPRTGAYHAIWIEGVPLNLEDPANKEFSDPLYGKTYLPRKFKIGFAIAPLNDSEDLANAIVRAETAGL
jgi:sulfite reductase (NADPH) hemoprotein beta-component